MLQAYLEQEHCERAVFEFFVRKLPAERNFLIAAGLEQVLEFLEKLRFSAEELDWLSGRFPPKVVEYCEQLRFSGDVHAMPEGTPFFPNEPILRVTAPLPVAQLVESRIINILHFETLIASKAARIVLAAPGKLLVDVGLRRAHGAEAGLLAARAAYLAGFSGTATVLANVLYGVPIFGTMAHSFIQSYADEVEAFEAFARSHPANTVLLIDTYDTEAAAKKVVKLARTLGAQGLVVKGVRIDSGDLGEHAMRVRRILDEGGLKEVTTRAAVSMSRELRNSSDRARRSTGLASGRRSLLPATRLRSIARTNCRNMRAVRGARNQKAKPPGREQSRCTASTMRMGK
jgi:nicotinate phosphoribosyltransferase